MGTGHSPSNQRRNHREARPVIAVTIGDPGGIGPEIAARTFSRLKPTGSAPLLVGAPAGFGPWLAEAGLEPGRNLHVTDDDADALVAVDAESEGVVVLDTGVADGFTVGEDSTGGGRHAGCAIERACELVRNWPVDAIVTCPISKKSLNLANFQFTGHTEMLARYLNAPQRQMMMVCGGFRVVPLTRHLPLRDVSDHVTGDSLVTCVRVVAEGLTRDFAIDSPRVVVAGLNPHAGDGGVIGDEEGRVIAPALERLRSEGIDVSGPVPADALFPQAYRDFEQDPTGRGLYDVYVAMYHDQGLAPFKMLAQRRGVNVTLGLPVVRTSVDHGVAYDIAGRGVAETESLVEAYKMAEEMCSRRIERARRESD